MEKYSRILIVIFFLTLTNLGLSFYIISKINIPTDTKKMTVVSPAPTKTATPSAVSTTPPNIQSDLNVIKAEIRSLRESLNGSGLILETTKP